MSTQLVVCLMGRKKVGMDTVADRLVQEHGFVRAAFADPIKDGLVTMLRDYGVTRDWFDLPHLKDTVIPALGVTARHLMTTLGTEWGQDMVARLLWVDALVLRLQGALAPHARVVVTDCRFLHEERRMASFGAEMWNITRPGYADGAHRSENEAIGTAASLRLHNDADIAALHRKVDAQVAHLEARYGIS